MTESKDFVKPNHGSTPQPDHIMLSICGDAKTSMAVTWRTSIDVPSGYVEVYPENGGEKVRVEAITKEFKSDIDISNMHWAIIKNLKPGTRYRYTCGDDTHRSEEFSFETEPENLNKFKFLIITDHQNGTPHHDPQYEPIRKALHDAFSKHPDIRFILTVGDNTNDGQNELQWNGMFRGMKGFIESYPYMMCTGNHDNRGFKQYLPEPVGKFYLMHADFFDAQFEYSYPKNGPEEFETENYSFDYGNVHFAVFGINRQDLVGEWLYEDLQKSDKTWKIGAYHFPIYPIMPEGCNDDSYPWLRKGIEEGRLDVLLAGHEHGLARTYPIKDDQMYDRPSEGTIHYIAGNAGRNPFATNARKIWHPYFYPLEESLYCYIIAEVDDKVLTLTAYLEDGRIADVFVIDKNKDLMLPYSPAPIFKRPKMAFKGHIPDLAVRDLYVEEKDGKLYCAFGALMHSIGGEVIRTKDSVTISVYRQKVTFTVGSDIAVCADGDRKLSGVPYMHEKGQIYVPVEDAAEIFGMAWQHAVRNRIVNFDYPSERRPMQTHPKE